MSQGLKRSLLAAGVIAPLWIGGAASAQEAGQADEVVVTAARRETTLQHIPQSVAVVDGDSQRDRGQQRLEDLQTSVPNVAFTNTSNSSQLYIRGIGNTFINAGGDPGVAFYQDGAYVSDQRTTNTSMFDIERVEILRGPQGALLGRNAVGGAINVISAKPTASPKGRVDVVAGDYGRLESEGYVSGPLGDSGLEGRLSYQARKLDGYTKNQLAGVVPGAPDRFDDQNSAALRGQLSAPLPGEGRLNLLASWYREDQNGPALSVVSVPGVTYPAQLIYGQTPTNDPRSVKATVGESKLTVSTLNATWVQPLGANTLTVTGNYRDGRQFFLNDCDGVAAEACRYSTRTRSKDSYAEAYLASPGDGAFRWIVGVSFVHFRQSQTVEVPWDTSAAYLGAGPASTPFFIHYTGGGDLTARSAAVYADLHYRLTDIWTLSGQLRYSETTKRTVEFQTIPQFGVNVFGARNGLKNRHTPFKLSLEGQLSPDVLVYASYATANKDGAINIGALQTTPVKPEEVQSWEIGEKASFFDHRLQVNGALFHSEYENLQIAQVVGTIAVLANAPKATVQGGELEVVAMPLAGLRMGAAFGYLDGKFDEFSNSPTIPGPVSGPLQNLAGRQLPNIARWSASLDLQYRFSPTTGYEARIGAQYAWRSRIFFNEFNDPTNSVPPGGVLNFSASFAPEEGRWRVYGYLNNATDRTYQTGSTIYSGLLGGEKAVNYAPPRHVGVGLSFSF